MAISHLLHIWQGSPPEGNLAPWTFVMSSKLNHVGMSRTLGTKMSQQLYRFDTLAHALFGGLRAHLPPLSTMIWHACPLINLPMPPPHVPHHSKHLATPLRFNTDHTSDAPTGVFIKHFTSRTSRWPAICKTNYYTFTCTSIIVMWFIRSVVHCLDIFRIEIQIKKNPHSSHDLSQFLDPRDFLPQIGNNRKLKIVNT